MKRIFALGILLLIPIILFSQCKANVYYQYLISYTLENATDDTISIEFHRNNIYDNIQILPGKSYSVEESYGDYYNDFVFRNWYFIVVSNSKYKVNGTDILQSLSNYELEEETDITRTFRFIFTDTFFETAEKIDE